jgi:hypothetical protein
MNLALGMIKIYTPIVTHNLHRLQVTTLKDVIYISLKMI